MTTETTAWIHKTTLMIGQAGFLAEIVSGSVIRHRLRDHPPTEYGTYKPRPVGSCGTHNGVTHIGRGVWRVQTIARNGRVEIVEFTDHNELEKVLEELGYPDLLDDLLYDLIGQAE